MDLKQLRYFARIADVGNMTRAAEALHIAQPALTQQVANLEAELGVQSVRPRPAWRPARRPRARSLYGYATSLLKQAEDAREAVRDETQHPSGRVVVGIPGSTGKLVAVPLLRRLAVVRADPAGDRRAPERRAAGARRRWPRGPRDRGRCGRRSWDDDHALAARGALRRPRPRSGRDEDLADASGRRRSATRPPERTEHHQAADRHVADGGWAAAPRGRRGERDGSAGSVSSRPGSAGRSSPGPRSATRFVVGLVDALPIRRRRLSREVSVCVSDTVPLSRATEVVRPASWTWSTSCSSPAAWTGAERVGSAADDP